MKEVLIFLLEEGKPSTQLWEAMPLFAPSHVTGLIIHIRIDPSKDCFVDLLLYTLILRHVQKYETSDIDMRNYDKQFPIFP